MKRFWSAEKMKAMLSAAKIASWPTKLSGLSNDDWNELGDWLYYQTNPRERDSVANRPRPAKIIEQIGGGEQGASTTRKTN